MKGLLENQYSDFLENHSGERICVDGFWTEDAKNGDMDYEGFAGLYSENRLSAIIIPKEYYLQYNEIIQKLIKCEINVNDIYNGMRLEEKKLYTSDNVDGLITPMLSDSYLSYLEYHVADHCNMNCKYCTHFSPLVKEPVMLSPDSVVSDLKRLKSYIDDIGVIRILGGEPLLNPDLSEFVEATRQIYPKAVITVVTNGLLLDRINRNLINTMQRCVAFFHISYYPPLKNKIDEIKKFLVDQNIAYTISPLIDEFNKTQLDGPTGNKDFFYSCFQARCNCIYDGKLAPCFAPFMTKYFNEAFEKDYPVNEGIDLYDDENTTESIKLKLLYPLERCLYCTSGRMRPWEIVGKNSKLEDWVKEND